MFGSCLVVVFVVVSCILVIMVRALCSCMFFFFFQAEDGIRDLVRSRGLGDVYKRQGQEGEGFPHALRLCVFAPLRGAASLRQASSSSSSCLLYTSDAADERSSVDLGGRRIIKKKRSDMSRGAQCV